jgi:uncharacterized protein YndB with AHSA1/START domain
MTERGAPPAPGAGAVSLVVRRLIAAPAARVFAAWTQPAHLERWWGPRGVSCVGAEVDLRVGGRYRIGNRDPDGRVVWISGEFELVAPPHKLVYTWRIEPGAGEPERVTVRFEPRGEATEVIVVHERLASAASRDLHARGWEGCLEGLAEHLRAA